MAVQPPRHKGVTPPISWKAPKPEENAANDALVDELKRQNNFESSEETERRARTLDSIYKITIEFVKVVGRKKGLNQSLIDNAGGKIFTYGSYRLGVYGPGSDIDTLVVVPKHVERKDFFEHFPPLLQKMAPPGAIEEMTLVPDAYVPIIKLEFSGISIDLIFASLDIQSVPLTLDLKDKEILKGLDDKDLRSVNGTRVTDEILELVPQEKTFRTALRAVKLWAQRRAIYANVMGFPGGVAWAMLVARVCQLYPAANGSVILGKFFHIIGKWSWPQPVILKAIEGGPLRVRIWNPVVYPGDRFHLMPIITPAYPSMCATHNVTMSTREIVSKELNRGSDIVNQISTGRLAWKHLFDRHTFFTDGYKYYLSIVSGSHSKEAQGIWSGLVESKVRHLVLDLEQDEAIEIAHPFNKGFERVHRCKNQEEIEAVIAGDLTCQITDIKTETTDQTNDPRHAAAANGEADNIVVTESNGNGSAGEQATALMYTTTYYIGIQLDKKSSKTLDISWQTQSLKQRCIEWQNYKAETNFLTVVHTRNYDLPADVFDPGETKPVRQPKRRVARKIEPPAKKRFASEMEDPTTSQDSGKRRISEIRN